MSTDWYFYCATCDEDGWGRGHDLNHAGQGLHDMLAHFPLFVTVARAGLDLDTQSLHAFNVYTHIGGLAWWALEHDGHRILVKSEYGDIWGTCSKRLTCAACGGDRQRCGLPDEHEGDCKAEVEAS